MKKYCRVTTPDSNMCDNCPGISSCHRDCYPRIMEKTLISLENKIEEGRLVEREEGNEQVG